MNGASVHTNGHSNSNGTNGTKKSYKYKLIYFEDRGKADLVKLLLYLSKQEYEDIQIKQVDWNHYKAFMPFEQLPVLIINDECKLAQTNTICRFLAAQFNLNGDNELENVMCDMIVEQLRECGDLAFLIIQEIDSVRRHVLMNKFVNDLLPKTLAGYEKILSKNSNKYIVGNHLTWADLALVNGWEWLDDACKKIINLYPLVKSHNEFIRSIPEVGEWLKLQKPLRVLKKL